MKQIAFANTFDDQAKVYADNIPSSHSAIKTYKESAASKQTSKTRNSYPYKNLIQSYITSFESSIHQEAEPLGTEKKDIQNTAVTKGRMLGKKINEYKRPEDDTKIDELDYSNDN